MARPPDRFITGLSVDDLAALEQLWKQDTRHRVRSRAQAILLSHRGLSVGELCRVFGVARTTVLHWLDRWDAAGLNGLEDEDHPRAPRKLNDQERALAIELVQQSPREPDKVLDEIARRTGKTISRKMLQRLVKAAGLIWKRMRQSMPDHGEETPERIAEVSQAKDTITEFHQQEAEGQIDLWFFDEAGFSLTPPVPYGWQKIGETTRIPSSRGGSIQTLGFLSTACDLQPYCIEGSVDSQAVAAVFDAFAATIAKPTIVVLDNAPVHTSDLIERKREEWLAKGLELYYLPTYCPELNLIEILWRAIKHRWLPLKAYRSFANLKACLNETLQRIGSELSINFSDLTKSWNPDLNMS